MISTASCTLKLYTDAFTSPMRFVPEACCLELTLTSTCGVTKTNSTDWAYIKGDHEDVCFFFIFFHTFTFQLLDKPWSQVSPLLPPGYCL